MANSIRGNASGITIEVTAAGALIRNLRVTDGSFNPGIGSEDSNYVGHNGPVPEQVVSGTPMLTLSMDAHLGLFDLMDSMRRKALGEDDFIDYVVNAALVWSQPGVGSKTVTMADCTVEFADASLPATPSKATQGFTLRCEQDAVSIA
jgi:hypothetical protein